MLKRFQIIDLFYANKNFDKVNEWIDVNKQLPKEKHGIFKVKLSDISEVLAYYCSDKGSLLLGFSSYWYKKGSGDPLYNVTSWAKNSENED